MKKLLCVLLVLCMMIPFVGCSKEPFEIQSCGSGFYFNRSDKKTYKIKELDAVSEGNYFYLEDYFVSDTLGEEYEIKKGLFKVGTVRLAKKSDHYNPEEFKFDVLEYNNRILAITPEMQYVHLYSGEEGGVSNLQIQIMPDRELPLDITLDGVRILTKDGIPTIFSSALTDVNFILIGENELHAGAQIYTLNEIVERANNKLWSEQETHYYKALEELDEGKVSSDEGENGDAIEHFFNGVTGLGKGLVDTVLGGVSGLLDGVDGFTGADGAMAVILPAGVTLAEREHSL
ncbi:MAG: hypothetical protein IJV72_03835 [Clostridia bacterium]|nr:hypothetical protein [Clostridia bacterium]